LKSMAARELAGRQPIPTGGEQVMLNFRVSQGLRDELRRVAGERGLTLRDAFGQAIALWLGPVKQE